MQALINEKAEERRIRLKEAKKLYKFLHGEQEEPKAGDDTVQALQDSSIAKEDSKSCAGRKRTGQEKEVNDGVATLLEEKQ